MLYILENVHGKPVGLFTSMQALAEAVAALPAGERQVTLGEFPPDELSPGQYLDLDELPVVPGAWWLDEGLSGQGLLACASCAQPYGQQHASWCPAGLGGAG